MTERLSRKALIEKAEKGLQPLGYKPLAGPTTGCAALFWKRVEDLNLTLGFEFSTRYKDRFTASWYLAQSFHWGYMLPGFPTEAYRRVGATLPQSMRAELLESEFAKVGAVDAWWIGFNSRSMEAFLEAVRLDEPRFLAQPGLLERIHNCPEMQEHVGLVSRTKTLAKELTIAPRGMRHQSRSYFPAVPPPYYWAAETVLTEVLPKLVSPKYVELVAIDTWRLATAG